MAVIPLLDACASKKAKNFYSKQKHIDFKVKLLFVCVILQVPYSNCFEQNRKQQVIAHSERPKNIWNECYYVQEEILFSNGKD